ncbi:MAG: DUF1987 domain-containing protein [Bacteroidia bacterium]|nr:DUF1987 domain-containing protein [Bacteroidia bacterium]
MQNLYIKGTKRTPEISFKLNGYMSISGMSIPENVTEFYKPALDWLENIKKIEPEQIQFTVDLDYLNTSTSSHLIKLFRKVIDIPDGKTEVKIVWKYDADEEDMLEQGKMYEGIIKHPFEFVKKS